MTRGGALWPLGAAIGYWSVWVDLATRIRDRPELVVHAAALFAGLMVLWRGRAQASPEPLSLGAPHLLALACVVLFALAFACVTPMVRCLIALVGLFTATWAGRGSTRPMLGLSLLLLAVPALDRVELLLGLPLRISVADAAAALLRLPGMAVASEGTRLVWDGRIVAVDAPCSGLRMLWTGAFTTLLALWRLAPGRAGACLICVAAAGLVWLGNVFRCASLFYVESGLVSAPRWAHAGVGLAVFTVVCLGLWETSRWIVRWRPSW